MVNYKIFKTRYNLLFRAILAEKLPHTWWFSHSTDISLRASSIIFPSWTWYRWTRRNYWPMELLSSWRGAEWILMSGTSGDKRVRIKRALAEFTWLWPLARVLRADCWGNPDWFMFMSKKTCIIIFCFGVCHKRFSCFFSSLKVGLFYKDFLKAKLLF